LNPLIPLKTFRLETGRFEQGDLLVTVRTDPDWEPILKKALFRKKHPAKIST
jgi:phosphoenolpyruvate synthase/pyruvate phosphate dikinase